MTAFESDLLRPEPSIIGLRDASTRRNLSIYRAPVTLCCLALTLASIYAICIRPGSAADEPAHFQTVTFYANHWRMPVLGQPEVAYEGQMGPVYYTLAGAIYSAARLLDDEAAFYAIRLITASTIVPIVWLTWAIARQVAPGETAIPLLAALFIAVNPSLLALAGSIQNDSLTIVFCLAATHRIARLLENSERSTATHQPRQWAIVAVIVSLAILTKATAVYLAVGTCVFLAWELRKGAITNLLAFASVVGVCCGWWFLRNQILYGDFSAQRALTLYHYNNNPPPLSLRDPSSWGSLAYGLLSQWLVPTEYYRNVFRTPASIRGLAATLYAIVSVAAIACIFKGDRSRSLVNRKRVAIFLALQVGTCLAIWVFMCGTKTLFASRCTHPTLPLVVIGAFGCLDRRGITAGRRMPIVVVASVLAVATILNFYVLHSLIFGPIFPFHMFVEPGGFAGFPPTVGAIRL